MKRIFAAYVALMISVSSHGQKDKYKFAQTYVGAQFDAFGGSKFPEYNAGRFIIGGTHFWQKADFYISVPLFTAQLRGEDRHYNEGVITGFRYIPFGLSRTSPRPFVGAQWLTPEMRIGDGALFEKSRFGLEAGLNIAFGSLYTLELSAHHVFNNDVNYAISREGSAQIHAPDFGLSIALKKYFDTTANLSSEKSKAYVKQRYDGFAEEGKLSTWNMAIGLSANVSVSDVPVLDAYAFMPNRPPLALHPDIALGYYFHKMEASVRLSWRPMNLKDEAYGLEYNFRQHRFGFEGFKFLFDYKGFVPFLGFSVGTDFIDSEIKDGELPTIQEKYSTLSYGITFGWDIRPTDTEAWVLRTNLRYLIQSDSTVNIVNTTGRNLEINFIQMVIYPSRWN